VSRDKDALLDMLEMIDLIEEHGPTDSPADRGFRRRRRMKTPTS
jgi:hypothetical protein